MPNKIDPQLISIRDIAEEDIHFLLDYWFRSPPGFIESLGVDFAKMPQEVDMANGLKEKCREKLENASIKLRALMIIYDTQPIGFHTINPLVNGEFGIFHAHIWQPEMRHRGVATHTYPKACQIFFQRFNLKRIVFKTPVQNIAAIRVKEKLGIRYLGEDVIDFNVIKDGTLAKVYELTRGELLPEVK